MSGFSVTEWLLPPDPCSLNKFNLIYLLFYDFFILIVGTSLKFTDSSITNEIILKNTHRIKLRLIIEESTFTKINYDYFCM